MLGSGGSAMLLGSASVVPNSSLAGGVLQLTGADYGQQGSVVIAFDDDEVPVDSFDAHFTASFSGGVCGHGGNAQLCGADGLSFVFGPLPEVAFGPEGAGPGLRVSFLTGSAPRVEVSFAYEELVSVAAACYTWVKFQADW